MSALYSFSLHRLKTCIRININEMVMENEEYKLSINRYIEWNNTVRFNYLLCQAPFFHAVHMPEPSQHSLLCSINQFSQPQFLLPSQSSLDPSL